MNVTITLTEEDIVQAVRNHLLDQGYHLAKVKKWPTKGLVVEVTREAPRTNPFFLGYTPKAQHVVNEQTFRDPYHQCHDEMPEDEFLDLCLEPHDDDLSLGNDSGIQLVDIDGEDD